MLKEFKEFAIKSNAVDMAVGIIIGAAFGAIVQSLVSDIMMPVLGLLIGKFDFSNLFFVLSTGKISGPFNTLAEAKAAGAVTINIGPFISVLINFLIVALALFMMVKSINRLKKEKTQPVISPEKKDCPFCLSSIPRKATRCSFCTSELNSN